MQQIKITNTVYESGHPKYLGGQLYPVTEDTLRQVALHNGEEVDEPTEAELQAQAEAEQLAKQQAEQQASAEAAPAQAPATAARKRAAG